MQRRHRRPRDDVRAPVRRGTARRRWSTSPPRATSTARSTARATFVRTNIVGTFELLEAAARCCTPPTRPAGRLPLPARLDRRGLRHRSAPTGLFSEDDALRTELALLGVARPRPTTWCAPITTPTALPALLTNCSNNYGPYQFPEKLIPLMILNALEGKPLPIYGDGGNVRDWLYVEDHCRGDPRACSRPACPARSTTSAAATSAPTCRSSTRSATRSRRRLPAAANPALGAKGIAGYARPQDLRRRPARPRPPLRDRRLEDPRASSAGAAPRPSTSGLRGDRALVPRPPRLVRGGAAAAATAASGSG